MVSVSLVVWKMAPDNSSLSRSYPKCADVVIGVPDSGLDAALGSFAPICRNGFIMRSLVVPRTMESSTRTILLPSICALKGFNLTFTVRSLGTDIDSVENLIANHLSVEEICKKIGEEASETIIAAMKSDNEELACELADLYYHTFVLMNDTQSESQSVNTSITF